MYTPIWNAVERHLSVERMKTEIAEFFEFSRWSSFDKLNALAQRITAKMEAAGLERIAFKIAQNASHALTKVGTPSEETREAPVKVCGGLQTPHQRSRPNSSIKASSFS